MAELNHTIVWCRDKQVSAEFLTSILGLPPARPFLHFLVVDLGNRVSMDFYQKDGDVAPQHYAFLVSDAEFDEILGRIRQRKLRFWADPGQTQEGEINHHDGGRGVYFEELNGHLLEAITRPYGSGGWNP